MSVALAKPIPPEDEHAISVSLPEWKHMVGWGKRDRQLIQKMEAGYPRFFIPLLVRELAQALVGRAISSELVKHRQDQATSALIFPHYHMAKACHAFLQSHSLDDDGITVLIADFKAGIHNVHTVGWPTKQYCSHDQILIVLYPEALVLEAKAFWMHTGFGISSRCAAYWLANLSFLDKTPHNNAEPGPKLPHEDAVVANVRIRERIAKQVSSPLVAIQLSDITLFHTGMSAIWHSGELIRKVARDPNRTTQVAVFGFLYVDTIKVLERILGFSVILYGHGSSSDLDRLETDLECSMKIEAIYFEFPGNPLLRSPDLHRIRDLSRRYHFKVVVDDTVATMSLDLAPYCDIVCTSLTKMFSGACNVMGGSLTLPNCSEHHEVLSRSLKEFYVDTYFPIDAIVMDNNSDNLPLRMELASRNAEHLVSLLQQHSQVAEVFYPKGSASQGFYDVFKRKDAGYGFLLSVRFVTPSAAHRFYDALDVAKGPSLGTEFTLCCAYTWLAHASELDWAAEFGVVEDLVRISTGTERWEELERTFEYALAAI